MMQLPEGMTMQEFSAQIAEAMLRLNIGDKIKAAITEATENRYGRGEIQAAVNAEVHRQAEKYIGEHFRELIAKRIQELLTPVLVEQAVQTVVSKMVKKLFEN